MRDSLRSNKAQSHRRKAKRLSFGGITVPPKPPWLLIFMDRFPITDRTTKETYP
ncbi:MAG: hypothetical protein K2Q22_08215 [Cytophagales bacterium]|nr:hypothetical protein [Cytophagales bacterium]